MDRDQSHVHVDSTCALSVLCFGILIRSNIQMCIQMTHLFYLNCSSMGLSNYYRTALPWLGQHQVKRHNWNCTFFHGKRANPESSTRNRIQRA